MHYRSLAALVVTTFAFGCGGDDGGGGGGGGGDVGADCVNGAGCEGALYCQVPSGELVGTCTEPPAACGASVTCGDSACTEALRTSCETTSVHCMGRVNKYTVACESSPPPRALGEECSTVVPCVAGTFCDIKDIAEVGTCTELPAACAGDASCECLQSVIDACTGGHSCSVSIDRAYVACAD